MVGVKPAIAQLVEHLTVELAEIRWSLVRFDSGWPDLLDAIRGSKAGRCCAVSTGMSHLWDSSPRPLAY